MLRNLGLAGIPQWISDSFMPIQATLVVIMSIAALVLILCVLVSPPQTGIGKNVITGASESYYTKNKSKNSQGMVKLTIIICAFVMAICAILYFVLYGMYPGE